MIAYLDASALVKLYVEERWSRETVELTARAEHVATSLISRAEVAAALAKSVRAKLLEDDEARAAQRHFAAHWPDIVKYPVTDALVLRADTMAWAYGLRGYDAVQLASAVMLKESAGADVRFASFDKHLWDAARRSGLPSWPDQLQR